MLSPGTDCPILSPPVRLPPPRSGAPRRHEPRAGTPAADDRTERVLIGLPMRNTFVLVCLAAATTALHAQSPSPQRPKVAPTVDQILSLRQAGSPEISPDGRRVAYTIRE